MHDFDAALYLSHLKTASFGRRILVFPELESTNTWLKTAAVGSLVDGMVCLTDRQIKGRGQYHKSWVSEPCSNLTWSYLLRPDSHDRLFLLTLACINAVANVIEGQYGLEPSIKWPNDLMIGGKKVAGVLAEAVFNGNHFDRFVTGIGLNVNQQAFPDFLPDAASLAQLLGQALNREHLMADIVNETETQIQAWTKKEPELVQQINRRLIGYGKKVNIEVDGSRLDGEKLLLGVNGNGHLHLLGSNYEVHTYSYEQVRIFADVV
jgi:BirA family biotin operon repressor/biotin-[acetyl-CoA-carboxylase] ligase